MRKAWHGKYAKKTIYHLLFERQLIKRASALHYTTQFEQRESKWLGINTPYFVIPNPVNIEEFQQLPPKGSFRKLRKIPDDMALVLYLGRIEPRKGLDLTLCSFAKIALDNSKVHLVMAGPEEDGYGKVLRKMASDLGIGDRVVFTDYLNDKERLSALVDADIFILNSYTGNFGMAVAEAMAVGLPVVISDKVGIAEEIRLR